MPIEHEYKFILKEDTDTLEAQLSQLYPQQLIHQVYCTKNNRFREIIRTGLKGKVRMQWLHTFKKKIDGKILEIESNIDRDDFRMVSNSDNLAEIHKIRYSIPQENGQWDVDFLLTGSLKSGGRKYFALAECEQPEDVEIVIPEIIAPFIRYMVPHAQSSVFSNFKLSNLEYAGNAIDANQDILILS